MKLNQQQIEDLKLFIKKKGVLFQDVRLELLDHLACRIEAIWEEDPKVSFESALKKVYTEFGVFGLSTFEENYTKGLQLTINNVIKEAYKSCFTTYKLAYVFMSSVFVFLLFKTLSITMVLVLALCFVLIPSIFIFSIYLKERKRYKKYSVFNMTHTVFTPFILVQITQLVLRFGNLNDFQLNLFLTLIVNMALLVLYVDYITIKYILYKSEDLEKMYGKLV